MCEICANNLSLNSAYDPTKTTTLRNLFAKDMDKRFNQLTKAVYKKVFTDDFFGLNSIQTNAGKTIYPFTRSAAKVEEFMIWLKQQADAGILSIKEFEQIGAAIDKAWTNVYITDSYKRGVIRARYELQKVGYDVPSITATGGIEVSMMVPMHMNRLGLLYSRTYSDLKGITSAMDTQISRVLTQAMADGDGLNLIVRKLLATINGTGLGDLSLTNSLGRFIPAKRRATILARTEIVRAHHQAMIQEYINWGLEGIIIQAEFITAGDDRVCSQCEAIALKSPYTLEVAMNLIPVHPQCFIDSQIPIYTSKGWKPIGKIEIGDKVLTHKKRFRKVYALPRSKSSVGTEVITFTFKTGHTISITANHLVLVSKSGLEMSRWKEAGKCTKDDQIMFLSNTCKHCGKLIPYYSIFCDHTCWSKDTVKKQWENPEHRRIVAEKNSIAINKQYASGERNRFAVTKKANEKTRQMVKDGIVLGFHTPMAKYASNMNNNTPEQLKRNSDRMKLHNPMNDPEIVQKAKDSLQIYYLSNPGESINARTARARWNKKGTWIEQRMSNLLDKIGVEYIPQYPILRYKVDFAIPALKIVIECDGEQWHTTKTQIKQDKIRQNKIEKEGWFVLRYTGAKINQCMDEIGMELKRVLSNHTGAYLTGIQQIQNIKKWNMKRGNMPLYNLSVEEDESYIAKGMVVHNCRCIALPYDVPSILKQ